MSQHREDPLSLHQKAIQQAVQQATTAFEIPGLKTSCQLKITGLFLGF
jgi:hypothetical protein